MNDLATEGDVALYLVSAIALQLNAQGLLNIDLLREGARLIIDSDGPDRQKRAAEAAIELIEVLRKQQPRKSGRN